MLGKDNIIGYIFTHKIDKDVQILNFAIDIAYQHQGYGEKLLFGDYFVNAQGEDVVACISNPQLFRNRA